MNINIPPKVVNSAKQVPSQSSNFVNSIFKTPQESVKNIMNNKSIDSVKDMSKNLYDNSVKKINEITTSPSAIIGLIILVILTIIIAYVMYTYVEKSLFNQSKYIIEQTKLPIVCTKQTSISLDRKIESTGNGLKRSYTFWVYIKDNTHTNYKNLLYIGNDKIHERGPTIFLDKRGNRMFVRFAKNSEYQDTSADFNFGTAVDTATTTGKLGATNLDFKTIDELDGAYNESAAGDYSTNIIKFMRQGIVIPYIPIQRWVHIGIVVNDYGSSDGGSIIAYVDGELVAEALHGEKITSLGDVSDTYNINYLNLDYSNKLVVGGDNNNGVHGLLSKFTIYNYDLNDRDIYNDYAEGPIDNFLAKLGLGAYGLRNPVYRIS
jgi:hypothetical protein